ncbi:ester cyclase [Acidiphilium acidophilum]|uniref:ester cyclase n=1 Tax=Acidiphilium acidophilum TaxID=76588 RepID=UPI002E8E6DCB|nr:ester cyclase [Acidiphilium acidophilum]
METITQNKDIASEWFSSFWGNNCDMTVVRRLCSDDITLQYSMNCIRRGPYSVLAFMVNFRDAFPDLNFKIIGNIVTDRDIVVIRWEARGTHTGAAFHDFNIGPFPNASHKRIYIVGQNATRIEAGKIVEEAVWVTGSKTHLRCIAGGARQDLTGQ